MRARLGRIACISGAILLEIGLFVAVLIWFQVYFVLARLLNIVFGVCVFLHLLNKRTKPEFKLPWVAVMILFPFLGTVLYVIFAEPRLGRRGRALLSQLQERRRQYIIPDEKNKNDPIGLARLLETRAHSVGYFDSDARFFSSGIAFYEDLLRTLATAEHFVFMEYFILAEGEMWDGICRALKERAAVGVEVSLLYDDIGTAGRLSARAVRDLQRAGIRIRPFNRFHPTVSTFHNNRDHRKIAVIDGRVGYTGGINIGDEYIERRCAYGRFKDSAVRIEGNAVRELTVMFLEMVQLAGERVADYAPYLPPLSPVLSEGYIHPFGDGPSPLVPSEIAAAVLSHLVNTARETLYITTPYLIPDHTLLVALQTAAARGVDVRIVTPHIPDKRLVFAVTRSHYAPLMAAGVKIYEYTPGFLHAKQIYVDGQSAFVGTVNLDHRSLSHHFECGVLLHGLPAVQELRLDFESLFSVSEQIDPAVFRQPPVARLFCAALSLFFPLL